MTLRGSEAVADTDMSETWLALDCFKDMVLGPGSIYTIWMLLLLFIRPEDAQELFNKVCHQIWLSIL